jgi:hypothetical protein
MKRGGFQHMDSTHSAIAALRDEFDRWEALIAGTSEERLTAPRQPGGWSVKDVLAHLHAWQQVSIARVEAALHDAQPVMPGWVAGPDPDAEDLLEQFNATIYRIYHDLPWPAVHQAWRAGFLRLIALAERVPARDLLAVDRFAWMPGSALIAVLEGSLEHHREHQAALVVASDVQEQ